MKELWLRGADRWREGNRDSFDPVVEGERHGLDRELALALWERACAEATDSVGWVDQARAQQRFQELVALLVARGGRVRPAVGRLSRSNVDGHTGKSWQALEPSPRAPGRDTRVLAEARRWAEEGEAEVPTTPLKEEPRPAEARHELPGAREVVQAMHALQGPRAGQTTRLDDAVGTRLSRLFGVDLTKTRVVPESPAATGATTAVTRDGEVHFRAGAYRPGTSAGDWLIAHELAHVVQQRGDRGERTATTRELEREADRAATLVSRGWFAPIALRAQPAAAYAFNEGEAHDEAGEDAGGSTQADGGGGSHETLEARPHEPASHPEAAEESDAAEHGHEGEDGHDALAADEHAISAPLPAEDAPGAAPGGGGGPAPRPQKETPSVAGAKPEAGLAQLHGVRPDKLTQLFGQVHTANAADVGKERAAQKAHPPKQMSTGEAAAAGSKAAGAAAAGPAGAPKAGAAAGKEANTGKEADPKAAAGAPGHGDQPVKAEVPGGEAAKKTQQDQATAQREAVTQVVDAVKRSIASWFGSLFGHSDKEGDGQTPQTTKVSEEEARSLAGSVDRMPTTASDVSTDTGPAPELAMKGEARISAAKDRADLEKTTTGLETLGRADSRQPMGEDHIDPMAAPEELTAHPAAAPGGAGPDAALPTVAGAASSEEVGIVAQEQHGAEIDAALTKASGDVTAERGKHEAEAAKARAESDAQVAGLKAKADADQAAARTAAQAEVTTARGQWQSEIDKQGADARKQGDKKVAEGMAQVSDEETKANAEARKHIDEGKQKADEEKQKGEKDAADAKDKGKPKSSGFWGWISSKAKAAFDGIKKAVSAAIDACRKAVKAVIAAAKKLAMAAIELARKAITGLIKAIGKALIAISDVLLAAFPGLKRKFQGLIQNAVDKAVSAVGKLADGLKQAVQKALDLLGAALDKALGLLEKGINAIIDAASAMVQDAIKAAQAVVEALGTWAKLIKDVASSPGSWIGKLGAAIMDGIKNHLWSAFKTAVVEWFKSKVFELLGVGGIILQLLLDGGMTRENIIQMALDALMVAIPAALIAILIEKLVSMIVPAAGAVMAIIEGLQAAWGTISRIIAAFSAFVGFLLAVKSGSAGPLFAGLLAAAAVVVLDFVANWLLKKLANAARKVGAKLKGLAEKFKAKRKAKKDAKANKHHDAHDANAPAARDDERHKDKAGDKDQKKDADKQKRLADAARAIRPKLAALIAKQPSKLRVRAQLAVWKLRYRLTELRMDPHGNQVEFIAKVNPEDKVGSAEDVPLGAELQKAESPRTGFYYRGDDDWHPGDSVGVPLIEDTPLPDAQELIDHVHPKAKDETKRTARGRDADDGPTKTFVSFAEIIGTKAGGAAKFTRMNRISKVAREALDGLVAEGKLRILTPDDVAAIIDAPTNKPKIRREAGNVRRTMVQNHEVLIQGLIPGDLLKPAK